MDKYTKVVLTLIAFALWANLFVSLSPPGRGLIRDANAQQLSRVVIVGVEVPGGMGNGLLPVMVSTAQPAPVYLTPGPSANPMVLPVNLAQIGARSFQQGVALPVDIEGIAGAAVKSSTGLPVTIAQAVAVTAKDPLPVATRDPLQVVVTKLPVSPAVMPTSMQPNSSTSTSGSTSTAAPPPSGGGSK